MKNAFALLLLAFLLTTANYGFAGESAGESNEGCRAVCQKIRQIARESVYVPLVDAIKPPEGRAVGSGLLIQTEEQFYILTNNHVVADPMALRIWVKFPGYFREEVRVVGRAPGIDLALLSVPPLPRGIKPAALGKSPGIGEETFAIGYPAGIRNITFGYVTATETPIFLFYATQAPISPGSSGGPLLNWKLEVAGINTAIVRGATISFAISVEDVKRVLPRLLREGIVRHGSAGFEYQDASDVSPLYFEESGLRYPPPEDRVMVTDIKPNSSAYGAGIRKGDIILKLNGRPVKNARELFKTFFFDYRPDDEVTFIMGRGRQIFERKVTLSSAK